MMKYLSNSKNMFLTCFIIVFTLMFNPVFGNGDLEYDAETLPVISMVAVEQPITGGLVIPEIARGYEELYARFLRGVLIYKPNKENDVDRVDLPIASLLNPLESTFDLSRCGDASQYLSISTGYRRAVNAENAEAYKWGVFITPKFFVERNVGTTAPHYRDILGRWTSSIAVIQNGCYNDLGDFCWYHATLSDGDLNTKNLYEIYEMSTASTHERYLAKWAGARADDHTQPFYLQF